MKEKLLNKRNLILALILVGLVYICFIDENSLVVSHRLHKSLKALTAEQQELQEGMEEDSINAQRLKYDKETIERYGREQYFMKRENEDVYIITKTKN